MPLPAYFVREDGALWFLLGFSATIAYFEARKLLHEFRAITVVTTPEKTQDVIGQHTEDAISVDTLGELYNSPNHYIQQASLTILVERAVREDNLKLLFRNAASKNRLEREPAMATLAFLATQTRSRGVITGQKLWHIVVDALESYLPEIQSRNREPYTDWKSRSKTERAALLILREAYNRPATGLPKQWQEAGLASRWLCKLPHTVKASNLREPPSIQRQRWAEDIREGESDDSDLEFFLCIMSTDPQAIVELQKADLLPPGPDPLRITTTGPPPRRINLNPPGNTGQEEDSENQAARRRRRREAVVIGTADQPLSQDNIFNATDTESDEFEGFSRVD